MGKRGPKPAPTALKVIKGTRADRINRHEPKPAPVAPPMPDFIEGEAKKEWEYLAPKLERLGVLKETDGQAFSAMCWAWAEFSAVVRIIKESGRVVITPNGHVQTSPMVVQARELIKLLKQIWPEFGLTPSARQGISVDPARAADDWEDLIK